MTTSAPFQTTHDVPVTAGSVHVAEVGDHDADPLLLLHGWPEDHSAWRHVAGLAASSHRVLALDLPGIGRSHLDTPRGDKVFLAGLVHEVVVALGLDERRLAIVGHDAGGMVLAAYLRTQPPVSRAVIMDTVLPGIPPWSEVLANPWIWHFAFHSIPALPERLVRHELPAYLDYFFEAITAHPERLDTEARARYVASYERPDALTQGFELYRAFPRDAADNADVRRVDVPLLYVRGSAEGGDLETYAEGLRGSGLTAVSTARVDDAGHFAPEEQPEAVWAAIAAHLR
jgi:pimeloyl-ACP methyl ester carboxylesterase